MRCINDEQWFKIEVAQSKAKKGRRIVEIKRMFSFDAFVLFV